MNNKEKTYKVYKIVNKNTGKMYIGATSTLLHHRFKSHIGRLNKGETTYKLHNSMRKHGVDNFYIEKICECSSKEEMFETEKEYIKKYNTLEEGYNITEGGEDPPSTQGLKRPKHSEGMKENNPMYKKESRENFYKAIQTDEGKEKNEESRRKANTKEAKEKQAKKMRGENNPNSRKEVRDKKAKNYIIIDPQGNKYEIRNLAEFCRKGNLNCSSMTLVAQGRRKQHKGGICKYHKEINHANNL